MASLRTQGRALRAIAAEMQDKISHQGVSDPGEGVMIGYSTKLDWRGGPDHGWWVELLKDGERVAHMSLDEGGVTRRDAVGA